DRHARLSCWRSIRRLVIRWAWTEWTWLEPKRHQLDCCARHRWLVRAQSLVSTQTRSSGGSSTEMSEVRIRIARPDDAEIIGYHRARMFQEMGQIPSHLYQAFER